MTTEKGGQRSIWHPELFGPYRYSKELKIGDSSLSVLREVFRLNHEVDAFTITFYPLLGDSDDEETLLAQNLIWLPVDIAFTESALTDISVLNFNACVNGEYESRIMGIGSQVKLINGEIVHIPMMDFAEEGLLTVELIVEKFAQSPGVVLDSGNSYHFWGFNLLNDLEYFDFMRSRLEMEYRRFGLRERPIYDKRFIEGSIKRNFSALRIFGYPNTAKENYPEVEAIIR